MKDFLQFFLKLTILFCIGLILWYIIRYPNWAVYIFPFFFGLILASQLLKDKFLQIFILLVAIFIGAGILFLHHPDDIVNNIVEKVLLIIEIIWLIGWFIEFQKIDWKINSYETSWIEKKENIEKNIATDTIEMKNLQSKIYSSTITIQNYRFLEEIINKLTSISSIDELKNYVIDIMLKLFPQSSTHIYLNVFPESSSIENKIVEYVKERGRYLYVPDVRTAVLKHDFAVNLRDKSIKSVVCFPLEIKAVTTETGYLIIYSPKEITEDGLRLISILGHYIGLNFSNIKLFEHTKELAITDSLTQLYVHKYFKELLLEEIKRARNFNRFLSLAIFDLDNFKSINDTFGHNVGDKVLIRFADILRMRLRDVDIIARYGGDEFTVIFPDTKRDDAIKICEEIRNIVSNEVIILQKEVALKDGYYEQPNLHRLKFTISCGVGGYEQQLTSEEFIDRVDKALYQAKIDGKNRIKLC